MIYQKSISSAQVKKWYESNKVKCCANKQCQADFKKYGCRINNLHFCPNCYLNILKNDHNKKLEAKYVEK